MTGIEYIQYQDRRVPLQTIRHRAHERDAYPVHVHGDVSWEVCYVQDGLLIAKLGQNRIELRPGEGLVIGPASPHGFELYDGRHLTLMFRRQLLTRDSVTSAKGSQLLLAGCPVPCHIAVRSARRSRVEHLLDSLIRESAGIHPLHRVVCQALLVQLLAELSLSELDDCAADEDRPSEFAVSTVHRFCEQLRANLSHPWSLSEMQRRSGYSATQLSLFFRQVTGVSPCRWLCDERIRRARELLATSDKRIADIAFAVGFGSLSQFQRSFRDRIGLRPSEYRRTTQSR